MRNTSGSWRITNGAIPGPCPNSNRNVFTRSIPSLVCAIGSAGAPRAPGLRPRLRPYLLYRLRGERGDVPFPGEEALYPARGDWYRIEKSTCEAESLHPYDDTPIHVFICDGRCPRHSRPLACRLFPLAPLLRPDGVFSLGYPSGAYPICPLTRTKPGALHRGFRRAVRQVYRDILTDPLLFARYLDETRDIREETRDEWFTMMRR